ncbi:MAG: phosphodiester glycosidase family protein [Bacteroidota bacterium]
MKLRCVVLFLLVATSCYSQDVFKTVTFNNKKYFVADIDPKKYTVELFNKIDEINNQYSFADIDSIKGKKLVLIVNGGMFQKDLRPLGLYISHGKTYMKIKGDTSGYGNFYMQPNGVFVIGRNSKPFVAPTMNYMLMGSVFPVIATQSGPLLVSDGVINSHFTQGSTNLNIRNGVGVNAEGHIIFVNSEDAVNFYEFAELYRDQLHCENALYLDGVVSQYYAPEIHKSQQTLPLGVFIVVTKK